MFDNIKMSLAKAAPWFCYVEEVKPSNVVSFEDLKKRNEARIAEESAEARNTATDQFVSVDKDAEIPEGYVQRNKTIWELSEGEEVPEGFQRINDHECVQIDPKAVDPRSFKGFVKNATKKVKTYATNVAKIFVEVIPVNEETPLDLASQAVDAAFTSAGEAIVVGAATVFTAQYSLPIRVLSGIVASIAAAKAAEKWKHDVIHPVVEGYKGKIKTVCAAQHIDPEINMAFETMMRDGATQDECLEAVNTVMDAAYPTTEEQNEVFVMCKGNVGKMIAMASDVIEAKALEENKFYTEFLNKPFVEQKWFVKAKSLFKKIKEPFADPENRETTLKALRTYTFGVGLSAVAASFAGPAWPIVFFGGLVSTCCIGVSEIVSKIISVKKESVCNA